MQLFSRFYGVPSYTGGPVLKHWRLIKRYNEQIKALEELKIHILANVSHELRTPITVARGAIELAECEEDPAERAEYLNMALDALSRLGRIVDDMIGASRLMNGEIKPRFGMVNMVELINRICHDFASELKRSGITLHLRCDDTLPPVRGDRNLLMHALRNLMSNAIKFNREGGRITIQTEKGRGCVKICIADTGIGIPGDKIHRVFDVLYQIDSSPTRRYGGTGLGLAIVREIVEAHGGRVGVESRIGRGSTFCVTLPTANDAEKS